MNYISIILNFLSIFFYNTSLFSSFNAMMPFIVIVILILIYIFDNNRFSTELCYANNIEKINMNLLINSFEKNNFLFFSKKNSYENQNINNNPVATQSNTVAPENTPQPNTVAPENTPQPNTIAPEDTPIFSKIQNDKKNANKSLGEIVDEEFGDNRDDFPISGGTFVLVAFIVIMTFLFGYYF